jgi:uncharacterized RDD family membrane protein YckC
LAADFFLLFLGMAKIDVVTTQKVTIQYDTAGFMWRFIAWMIDTSIIFTFFVIVLYYLFSARFFEQTSTVKAMVVGVLVAVQYFYTLVIEVATNGQSIGKKITRIAVIKLNGNALEMNDYLIRWAYRAVDFGFSAYSIGTISILMSEKHQRLGDMIANTTVIKLKPERVVTLEDLQNLPDRDEYVPVYPQVVRYTDEEMLALKNLLQRYQQYNSPVYRELLHYTVQELKEQMQLNETVTDDVQFLKAVISEYVILTR